MSAIRSISVTDRPLLGIDFGISITATSLGSCFDFAYSACAFWISSTEYQYVILGLVLPIRVVFDSTIPAGLRFGMRILCTVLIGTPVASEISVAVAAVSMELAEANRYCAIAL